MNSVAKQIDFHTTNWTVVRRAADKQSPEWKSAIEQICNRYWYPLYVYVRQRGYHHQEAEDLIQGFFTEGLEKNFLHSVNAKKGRFRSFLLVCLKRHLSASVRRQIALKRGGGRIRLAIESAGAQRRFASECASHETPERAYERRWALALIEHALAELRARVQAEGHGRIFEMLLCQLVPGANPVSGSDLAIKLGLKASTIRVTLHRLRVQFRDILRSEIASTVTSPDEVDAEIKDIFKILGR